MMRQTAGTTRGHPRRHLLSHLLISAIKLAWKADETATGLQHQT